MNKKIVIGILIVIIVVVVSFGGYKIINRTLNNKYNEKANSAPIEIVDNKESDEKFSKVVDNVKLELNIPNEWKYEELLKNEENDIYSYALKLYMDNDSKYATLYLYYNKFAVCGTGRSSNNITLDNGKEANIGYYDENESWSDISFCDMNKNVVVLNYGLVGSQADELIHIIKTINFTQI